MDGLSLAPVESSTLHFVAYDSESQVLWLQFRSRAVYCYFDVPPTIHHELIRADSKGSYFNRNIRGCFPYCRLPIS